MTHVAGWLTCGSIMEENSFGCNIFINYNIYIINTSKSCRLFECKEWHHINIAIIITNTKIQVMHDPTVILKIQAIQNTV